MRIQSLPTKSQETTKSVTINNKTNPQHSTETPLSTTITAAPNLAQEEEKVNRGYNLKRSSVYLHLLPKNGRTGGRKQHVTTATEKLISAKNLKHQSYLCIKLTKATANALEELTGLLMPGGVTFHSQDIKLRCQLDIQLPQSKLHY